MPMAMFASVPPAGGAGGAFGTVSRLYRDWMLDPRHRLQIEFCVP